MLLLATRCYSIMLVVWFPQLGVFTVRCVGKRGKTLWPLSSHNPTLLGGPAQGKGSQKSRRERSCIKASKKHIFHEHTLSHTYIISLWIADYRVGSRSETMISREVIWHILRRTIDVDENLKMVRLKCIALERFMYSTSQKFKHLLILYCYSFPDFGLIENMK